jgi:hypothetical protein
VAGKHGKLGQGWGAEMTLEPSKKKKTNRKKKGKDAEVEKKNCVLSRKMLAREWKEHE